MSFLFARVPLLRRSFSASCSPRPFRRAAARRCSGWEDGSTAHDPAGEPAGVDAIDVHGETSLHVAAAHGRKDVVEALLAARANPKVTAPDGVTPLHYAALARDMETFLKRLKNLESIQRLPVRLRY